MKVSVFPPLLLLLLLISLCSSSHLGAHAAAGDHHHHEIDDFMVVETSSLEHIAGDAVCSGHKVLPSGDGVRWVPMNRPHGPCSLSQAAPAGMEDIIDDMLLWDKLRTSYIRRELSDGGAAEGVNSDTATEAVNMNNSMATTRLNLGSNNATCNASSMRSWDEAMTVKPRVRQTVVIDTSSNITWVRCLPCPTPQCHLQKDTFYDPANSGTYH